MPEPDPDATIGEVLRKVHARTREDVGGGQALEEAARRIFAHLRDEANRALCASAVTALQADIVLSQTTLQDAVCAALLDKLACADSRRTGADADSHRASMREMFAERLSRPHILQALLADLAKAWVADPATQSVWQAIFLLKGFLALATYRIGHSLWLDGGEVHRAIALWLQSRVAEVFGVDIHPAAQIGDGVMLDHATGVVVGATAVVGSDVYMLHGVTLGATGKAPHGAAKRHPTVGRGCVLGAMSAVLGDISIGDGATVGSHAVVTKSVPPGATVVGVNQLRPARMARL